MKKLNVKWSSETTIKPEAKPEKPESRERFNKKQMKTVKKISFMLLVAMTGYFMQSCIHTMSLNYSHATLSNNNRYDAFELQTSNQIGKSPFVLGWSIGIGGISPPYETGPMDFSGDDTHKNEISSSFYYLGIEPSYYFSFKRLQPFVGSRLNTYLYEDDEKDAKGNKQSYVLFSFTPNIGLRFFVSQRFAINGNIGYKMMPVGSGLAYSFGLAYRFKNQ